MRLARWWQTVIPMDGFFYSTLTWIMDIFSREQVTKVLIWLCRCTGWSAHLLFECTKSGFLEMRPLSYSRTYRLIFGVSSSVRTVKPAVAVTSIKRDPPLSGHFRVPPNDFECKCTSIKRAPVQRGQRSAKFAPKRLNCIRKRPLQWFDAAVWLNFIDKLFLHRSNAWSN